MESAESFFCFPITGRRSRQPTAPETLKIQRALLNLTILTERSRSFDRWILDFHWKLNTTGPPFRIHSDTNSIVTLPSVGLKDRPRTASQLLSPRSRYQSSELMPSFLWINIGEVSTLLTVKSAPCTLSKYLNAIQYSGTHFSFLFFQYLEPCCASSSITLNIFVLVHTSCFLNSKKLAVLT